MVNLTLTDENRLQVGSSLLGGLNKEELRIVTGDGGIIVIDQKSLDNHIDSAKLAPTYPSSGNDKACRNLSVNVYSAHERDGSIYIKEEARKSLPEGVASFDAHIRDGILVLRYLFN